MNISITHDGKFFTATDDRGNIGVDKLYPEQGGDDVGQAIGGVLDPSLGSDMALSDLGCQVWDAVLVAAQV